MDVDGRIQFGVDYGKKKGFLKAGNSVVICINGWDGLVNRWAGSSIIVRLVQQLLPLSFSRNK